MGKHKKRKNTNNNSKPNINSVDKTSTFISETKLDIDQVIQEEESKTKAIEIRSIHQRKRVFVRIKSGVFYFFAFLSLLALLGAVYLIILFLIRFFSGSEFEEKLFSFIQFITALASLGIGIWGIILALKTKGTSNKASEALEVRQTPVEPGVQGKLGESDINKQSI